MMKRILKRDSLITLIAHRVRTRTLVTETNWNSPIYNRSRQQARRGINELLTVHRHTFERLPEQSKWHNAARSTRIHRDRGPQHPWDPCRMLGRVSRTWTEAPSPPLFLLFIRVASAVRTERRSFSIDN